MTIIISKSPSLSPSQMLIIIIILLGVVSTVHSGMGTNPNDPNKYLDPYDPSGDDLGLYDPFYDNNNSNNPTCQSPIPPFVLPIYKIDTMLLQFAQNIEHLEADYFLWGALGCGLDDIAPQLTLGGPPPIGVRKANLDNLTESIIKEFGYEEVGHLRFANYTLKNIWFILITSFTIVEFHANFEILLCLFLIIGISKCVYTLNNMITSKLNITNLQL